MNESASIIEQINKTHEGLFPHYIGMELSNVSKEGVTGSLFIKKNLCNAYEIAHGGVIMTFADTLGAIGAFLNLEKNQKTTTIESKTNFFRPAPLGETIQATARLVNRSKSLMMWTTEVRSKDEKLIAVISQSQMIIQPFKQ